MRHRAGLPALTVAAALLLCGLHAAPAASEQLASEQLASGQVSPDEFECLALNVYFEAGGEAQVGQLAVAWVTLNRWADERFPQTICGVVKEGGEARYQCQFHWWCDGQPDVPLNPERWANAEQAARDALTGRRPDPTGGALYFHTGQVQPSWSREMSATAMIGNHIFYR